LGRSITIVMRVFFPFSIALLLIFAACDPGMTIYQTNPTTNQNNSVPERVTVRVKASHPLIGETWYAPDNDVTVTNSLDKPIVITKVELLANGTTYEHKHAGATNEYPLTVSAGKTETLPLWFELKDDVKDTFKTPAELRVYYRNGREESVAHAFIVGGPLDMKTP
jgi:hypothetical protein